jgi:transcriptional regulator with XRE-family HTH domain
MDKFELGRRVAQARDDAGMTQEGLGRAVGLDRSAISRLEKGGRQLNVPELVEIATALGRPLSYFVAETVPAVVSRRNDLTSARATTHLLDTQLGMFASDVHDLAAMGLLVPDEPRPTARVPRNHIEAERTATAVRVHLGINSEPIADLGQVCERLNLFTFATGLGESGPDGGFVEVGEGDASLGAAVINGDAPPGRRRMTLAHELGHHIFGDAYDSETSGDSERMINSFAIHLLAPRVGVRRLWDELGNWGTRDLALAVGASFKLSWSATVGHLVNLDLISRGEFRLLGEDQPRKGDYVRLGLKWSDELTGPYLSPGFTSEALNAYVAGRLTDARAIELMRGTLRQEDLPRQSPPTLEDLRGAFAGHDG